MPQSASYHPLYAPLLIFEMLGNVVMTGLNVVVLLLFFTKRRAFPNLFIVYVLCHAAVVILDDVGCALIPLLQSNAEAKNHREAIRAIFYAVIWSLYMVKSRRVKATFIN